MANKGPSEADIIFNRANVALARSQRLIESWLPPKTADELASVKTEEELQKEDEALFKPTPELLGVGAAAPDDDQSGLIRRKGPASNQRLLEQLLGKKAAKGHIASSRAPDRRNPSQLDAQKPGQSLPAPAEESDEEEGRASTVSSNNARRRAGKPAPKAKKATSQTPQASTSEQATSVRPREASSDEEDARPTKKRPASYLDQLLAEKASKKKKKQQQGSN